MTDDPYNLERFLFAQEHGDPDTFADAIRELLAGKKRSHWMWYVFPQIAGLGESEHNRKYAISGIDEAREYLAHRMLGPRLTAAAEAVLKNKGKSAVEILGRTDEQKLRSSMTLFERAAGEGSVFSRVLEEFFDGKSDQRTLELIEQTPAG